MFGNLPFTASAALVGHWTFESGEELVDRIGNFPDLILKGDSLVAEGKLDVNGSGTSATGWAVSDSGSGAYTGPTIKNKTLVVWTVLQGLNDVAKAGSLLTLDRVGSDHFDGIIFGERQNNRWMNGSSGFGRTADFAPGFEETDIGNLIQLAITYEHLDGGRLRVTGYRNAEQMGQYETGNPSQWDSGDAEILFGLRHGGLGGGPGGLDALIEEAQLYREALNANEILELYAPPLSLSAIRVDKKIRIEWTDATAGLEAAETLDGPWSPVADAVSPFEQDLAAAAKRYFRLRK